MSLIIGHIVGLLLFISAQAGLWTLHFTINVGIMTIFSALVFVVVSLRTAPPPEEQVELTTWKPALSVPETPMPVGW